MQIYFKRIRRIGHTKLSGGYKTIKIVRVIKMVVKEEELGNHSTLKLILLLFGSIVVWGLTVMFKAPILWFAIILALSITYIVKNRNVEKREILIGLSFGVISIPVDPILGIMSILAYLGAVSVLKGADNKINLYNKDNSILNTVLFVVVVGGALGAINIILSGTPINPSIKFYWVLRAFKAGITEEILFRFLFFAVCVRVMKDKPFSKSQNIICYLFMTIFHTLIHFDFSTFDLASVVMLTLLFGIPFAITLRKRDLTSAIGIHMFVDLIRFVLTGV